MRNVNLIVIHCSADEAGTDRTVESINKDHRARGFRKIGYHFLIHIDGTISGAKEGMRKMNEQGAHARGYNAYSVGVCYVGGLKKGKPSDTRTTAQIHALRGVVKALQSIYPESQVVGHRDLSVDLNGDGVITKNEWMKSCPCFEISEL